MTTAMTGTSTAGRIHANKRSANVARCCDASIAAQIDATFFGQRLRAQRFAERGLVLIGRSAGRAVLEMRVHGSVVLGREGVMQVVDKLFLAVVIHDRVLSFCWMRRRS